MRGERYRMYTAERRKDLSKIVFQILMTTNELEHEET